MEIEIELTDHYLLCRPVGELDAYTVGEFRDALSLVAGSDHLLIDLSEVPFIDSAGLNALIGGIRRAKEGGGEVAIACSRDSLARLLHTTGFDRVVPIAESTTEAGAMLGKAGARTKHRSEREPDARHLTPERQSAVRARRT